MKRSRLLPWLRSWSFLSYLLNGVLMAQMILLPCSSCKGVWITFDSDGNGIFETGYDDGTLPSDDSVPPTADPTEPETPLPPTGDADGDGLNNADESAAGSNPYNPDSDFDGLTDAVETSLTGTDPASTDSNHDGISDYNGFYGNTAVDQDLVGPGETPYDFDGDGLNDPVDPDPLSPSNDPDSDGDYVPDSQDTDPTNPTEWNDANHNGINDDAEIPNNDIDGDGISNDTDSHPTDPYLSNDWNYNGGNDQNEDWDGDGVSNLQDSHPNTNCQWCDWNGNGVNDDSESGSADSDGDGYSDNSDSHSYNSSLWEDWNGNGTNDSQESQNSDGDGYPDGSDSDPYNSSLWEDWNRNGSNDSQESQDSDGDGRNDSSDSDPQNISLWEDWNRNGANDSSETTQPSQDSDGDGYPDGSDTDPSSSNLWEDNNRNGYNDSNEDQFIDNDQDGRINAFDSHPNDASLWNDQNNNGQNDENEITIVDTDSDGYADSLDTHPDDPQRWNDHNNNGSNDELDVPADTDSDGLPDAQDPSPSDSDNDGLTNTEEVLNGTNPNNSDTDSDGSPDGVEQLTGTNPGNVDTDGDGLTDNEEQQAYFTDPLVPNPNSFSDTSNPPAAPSEGNDDSLPASNPDSSNTPSETPPVNNPPTESPPTNNPPVDNPPPNDPREPPQIKVFIQENENSADGIDSAYPAQSGETTSFPSLSLDKMQGDLTKTIFIRNDGEADLALGELIKSGPNSSEFSFSLFNPTSPSPTASLSLASNSVASLKVTFSAKPALAKISQTAILRIPSNDPIKNHFDITLTSIVPAGIWQSEGAYFSADLRDSDGDGIPDLVADMYKPLKVSATGDLDGDGVNNLSQYRQGRDLLNNVVTSDIDMDGLINQTEETWAKAYPGRISKYKFEDAYVDPDKDGLLTIEELNCTWGDSKVKDPAAFATNPFVKSTGPNNSGGTAALKSALTYKLTSRSAPANTTDPKLNWSYREADQVYAEWMNDGLLRRAYRASATNGIYPADFFAPRYSEIAPATATSTMNEVRGYDHLPLGYLRWLEKEIFPKIAVNVIPNIRIASNSAPINGKVPIAPWQVKNELETFMAVNDDIDVDRMPNVWEARYQLNWRMPTDGGFVQALASIDSRTKALKLTAADTLNLQRTGNTQSTLQALIQQHLSESFAASGQMMNNPNRTPNSRVIQLVNEYPIDRKVPAVLPAPPAASASALIQGAWRAKCDAWLSAFTAYHVWPYLAEIDPDHDGLVNADEYFLELNPNLADFTGTADRDTDKDGFTDAQELAAGTDSTKATSKPKLTLKVISGANQSGRPHGMIPHPIFIQSVYQGDKGGFCPAPGTIVTISAPNQFTLLTVINGSQTAASVAKENWIPKSLKLTTDLQGKAQFSLKLPHLKGTVTLGLIATQAALKTANVPITLSIVPDSLDTDGDGMSDAWEKQAARTTPLNLPAHALNATSAFDAEATPLHYSYHRETPLGQLPANLVSELTDLRGTNGRLKDQKLLGLTTKQKSILLQIDPDNDGLSNLEEYQQFGTGFTHPRIGSKPHITVQPKNWFAYAALPGKFSVSAITGDGRPQKRYLYQWFEGNSGDVTKPIQTTLISELAISTPWPTGLKSPNHWVRVTAYDQTNEGALKFNEQSSNSLTAYAQSVKEIEITEQPKGATIGIGKTVNLTVKATGGVTGAPLVYQWHAISQSTMAFQPILGATQSSYTTPKLTQDTTYYASVSYSNGSAVFGKLDSQSAAIIVPAAPVITQPPQRMTVRTNQGTNFKVTATGHGELKYQWGAKWVFGTPFMRLDTSLGGVTKDGFSSIMEESAKDNGLTTPIAYAAAGYYVKVAVSDSLGNITLSDPVTLFVTDSATQPTIVAEPKDTYRPRANGDYEFLVGATGEEKTKPESTLKYQWYRGKVPDLTQPIQGATSDILTISKAKADELPEVWVKVYNYRKYPDPVGTFEEATRSLTVPSGQIIASSASGGGSGDGKGEETLEPNEPFDLVMWQPMWHAKRGVDIAHSGSPPVEEMQTGMIASYFGGLKLTTVDFKSFSYPQGWPLPHSWEAQIADCNFPFRTTLSADELTRHGVSPADSPFWSDLMVVDYPSKPNKFGVPELSWWHSRHQLVAIRPDSTVKVPVNLAQGTEKTYLIVKTVQKDIHDKNPIVSVVGSHTFKIDAGKAFSEPMPDISQDNFQSFFSLGRTEQWVFNLLSVDLAIDANRDGTIAKGEIASQAKPLRFWINNDNDTEAGKESAGTIENSDDQIINTIRDLEDMQLLKLDLPSDFYPKIQDGTYKVGFKWTDTSGSTPAVKLFRTSADISGFSYLTSVTKAEAQLTNQSTQISIATIQGGAVIWLPASALFAPNANPIFPSTQPHPYLFFEGHERGSGKLTMVLQINGQQSDGPGVWLKLVDVKKMFDKAKGSPSSYPNPPDFTDQELPRPGVGVDTEDMGEPFEAESDEKNEAIVLVHGWNMTDGDWRVFSSSFFKRLWWKGYKGRFYTFGWPTHNADDDVLGFIPDHYNKSEYVAWKYGPGLRTFVNSIQKSAKNIAAHSMGNVVMASALKSGLTVNSYVAMQAALPAGCYDASDHVNDYADFVDANAADPTPNKAIPDLGYRGLMTGISGNFYNFFSKEDYALKTGTIMSGSVSWEGNEINYKPNGWGNLYYDHDPAAAAEQRNQLWRAGNGPGGHVIARYATDHHEIMSFIARPLSEALGARDEPTAGFEGFNLADQSLPYPFRDVRTEHSGQFQRPIQKTEFFYNKLLQKMGVQFNDDN